MTKILYWNIQDFGLNKINDPRGNKRQRGSSLTFAAASAARSQYIIDTLTAQAPDVFVVVETTTGAGVEGGLITAGGESGSQELLIRIRAALGANWMLVPAVRLGAGGVQEGISVYYNSATLDFTGPWGFQGGALPSAPAIAGIPYAGNWAGCLPAAAVPGGALINAGTPCNQLAGQWMYSVPALPGPPNRLLFPGVGNRSPFLTTFWDAATATHIKLLSFHASPNNLAAIAGTDQISNIQEMTANLGANEIGVIVGDFNVNLTSAAATPAYVNLIAAGGANYTRQINPTANYSPDLGYIATHIKPRTEATPWLTNGYPGYGYAGSSAMFANYDSIDNILTRYGAGAGGPATNITVVNRITGSPYNIAPVPAAVPVGHYVYATGMTQIVGGGLAGLPIALPLPPNGPTGTGGATPGNIGALNSFRGWSNYGHIRSTSDHLALIIDI